MHRREMNAGPWGRVVGGGRCPAAQQIFRLLDAARKTQALSLSLRHFKHLGVRPEPIGGKLRR
jgi:hypothetical protein